MRLADIRDPVGKTYLSWDQVWITYASGERVAGPPVAASDDALISMIRTWATRGGQTAREFSAAAPLVNVALAGNARLTATMAVTPRPCVSLRRHGQLDATLATLTRLGTIDATLAAFLAAAVKSRCNIIVTGGVNCGKPAGIRPLTTLIPARSLPTKDHKVASPLGEHSRGADVWRDCHYALDNSGLESKNHRPQDTNRCQHSQLTPSA